MFSKKFTFQNEAQTLNKFEFKGHLALDFKSLTDKITSKYYTQFCGIFMLQVEIVMYQYFHLKTQ